MSDIFQLSGPLPGTKFGGRVEPISGAGADSLLQAAEAAPEGHALAGPDAQIGGEARDEQERLSPPPRLVVDDRPVPGDGRCHFRLRKRIVTDQYAPV